VLGKERPHRRGKAERKFGNCRKLAFIPRRDLNRFDPCKNGQEGENDSLEIEPTAEAIPAFGSIGWQV